MDEMDFRQYGIDSQTETEVQEEVATTPLQSDIAYLTREQIVEFTKRLSGRNEDGSGKVELSYQTYAMEDAEDSPGKEQIFHISKACVELSTDAKNPGYFCMDIIFRSYDEPELKMLWGRLQRFKKQIATDSHKLWIFHFHMLEKASITAQTLDRDTLLTCNALNPLVFYLTREVPNMLAEEREVGGDLMGGNIIRMIIPTELVTFQITDEVDTSLLKGEVLRDQEESRYLDSSES